VRTGREALGIDVAEEPLRRARVRDPRIDVRLVPAQGPWPLQDFSFDALWAGEVIEHVADTAGWLSEARRVLRSKGVLVLSTPAHQPLTRIVLGLRGRAFESHFDPRADHLRFYTRRALVTLLEDFGFEAIETRSIGGPPGARRVLLASARRARF
jgi:ubiquinone/menaquinone biosynthesis C-methylase UbiE